MTHASQWDGCVRSTTIGIELDAAVVEEAGEPVPVVQGVADRSAIVPCPRPREAAARATP